MRHNKTNFRKECKNETMADIVKDQIPACGIVLFWMVQVVIASGCSPYDPPCRSLLFLSILQPASSHSLDMHFVAKERCRGCDM